MIRPTAAARKIFVTFFFSTVVLCGFIVFGSFHTVAEVLNGVTATYTAMIDYHGWSPARAQQEVDLKAAEMKAHLVDIGMKHIVDIVQDRQELTVTEAQKTEAAEVLFGATEPMEADVLADDKEVVNG